MKKRCFCLKLFIIFCFQFSFPLWGSTPPVVLNSEKQFYELGTYLDILEDTTSKLTIEDVTKGGNFRQNKKKVANFLYFLLRGASCDITIPEE